MNTVAAVLATTLLLSPTAAPTPPTYVLGGTGLPGMTFSDADIAGLIGGNLAGGQELHYPHNAIGMDYSIGIGAASIVDTINAATGPLRFAGVSQGALAISAAKQTIMALPERLRPAADQLQFVHIGDPSGPTGMGGRMPGLFLPIMEATFWPSPETPYDTIFVTREYDGFADFPDRPVNLLATANALAGILYVHPFYAEEASLDAVPLENITETTNSLGGKTTSYLVPTNFLPLLQPLRDLGVDERIIADIETPLRGIVDAGYSRNDATPETSGNDTEPDDSTVSESNHATKREAATSGTRSKERIKADRGRDDDSADRDQDRAKSDRADKQDKTDRRQDREKPDHEQAA